MRVSRFDYICEVPRFGGNI